MTLKRGKPETEGKDRERQQREREIKANKIDRDCESSGYSPGTCGKTEIVAGRIRAGSAQEAKDGGGTDSGDE